VLRFLDKNYESKVPACDDATAAEFERVLLGECGPIGDPATFVREFRFRRAAEQLLANAVVCNVFVDRLAPWTLRKTDPVRAGAVLALCCDWIALIARWMAPFMPRKAQTLWEMLGNQGAVEAGGWPAQPKAGHWRSLAAGQALGTVGPLFAKLDDTLIAAEMARLDG